MYNPENFSDFAPAFAQARTQMQGAQMVLQALEEQGLTTIFGYPGGSIMPVYDRLRHFPSIRHFLPRHEQAAGFAVSGYTKATGKTAVVLTTSGPGAINALAGVAEAMADSTPMVIITGQVPTDLIGTNAFQECDIEAMAKTCSKKTFLVKNIADLPSSMHEAIALAESGRPGPVVIDLPKDVQCATGTYESFVDWQKRQSNPPKHASIATASINTSAIREAVSLMKTAARPIYYTGGGIGLSGPAAIQAFRKLAAETGFPVTSTLMGLGTLAASNNQWMGMLGMHGTLESNMAMHESSLIIAIGARFDDRVTGKLSAFAPSAKIIHIDIDPREIGKLVKADIGIQVDCGQALAALTKQWRRDKTQPVSLKEWWSQIDAWRAEESLYFQPSDEEIKPQQAIQMLSKLTKDQDITITTGVGQHQMWVAQHFGFQEAGRLITSGSLGYMGYCLPSAIGAQIGRPDKMILCVTGDGSIQMNIQEMMTARAYDLPIKVLLMNNRRLGMVHQLMADGYQGQIEQTILDKQPDFVRLARAYGWKAFRCESPRGLKTAMTRFLASSGPALLDCRVSSEEKCYPIVPAGKGHHQVTYHARP